MAEKDNSTPKLINYLGMQPFQERFPWLGGDLQTLRDALRAEKLPLEKGVSIKIAVPAMPSGTYKQGNLLALLNKPPKSFPLNGLVVLIHGLGGSSRRQGLRRMAFSLLSEGFAVLRVNLRGADPSRPFIGGSYAAECNSDLMPVLFKAREICNELKCTDENNRKTLPLFGVGISLGGTILLNACLKGKKESEKLGPVLDGIVCTSTPLDLAACSASIERPRNIIYQRWLLNRLIRQTLADPFGVSRRERSFLAEPKEYGSSSPTIREFDSIITAPRWGYKDVDDYYLQASPLQELLQNPIKIPPTLFLQSEDDPWVPAIAVKKLVTKDSANRGSNINVILTKKGGHNGFHGIEGCWGDKLVTQWLKKLKKKDFNIKE